MLPGVGRKRSIAMCIDCEMIRLRDKVAECGKNFTYIHEKLYVFVVLKISKRTSEKVIRSREQLGVDFGGTRFRGEFHSVCTSL